MSQLAQDVNSVRDAFIKALVSLPEEKRLSIKNVRHFYGSGATAQDTGFDDNLFKETPSHDDWGFQDSDD
jgi:hypothetical protein